MAINLPTIATFTFAIASLFSPAAYCAAIGFTDAPVAHESRLSLGFQFTTNQDIEITALGYFDENLDGFLRSHTVGIYDSLGNLLTSTTLNAGSDAPLTGFFRYAQITPLMLRANSFFTIAATSGGFADGWAYGNANSTLVDFAVDPRISVASDAARYIYQTDNELRLPTDQFGYTLYGGPNFLLAPDSVSTVPEPATVTLTIAGLAGFAYFSRRRHI